MPKQTALLLPLLRSISLLTVICGAWAASSAQEVPAGSTFVVPPANACQSPYDRFYEEEPGVYAFWAMCESGTPIQIHDYAGEWDLTSSRKSYGVGMVAGGATGPVNDGETAASVSSAKFGIANQNIPMNTKQGTVATWINADASGTPVNAVLLQAVAHKSDIALGVVADSTGLCFTGEFTNSIDEASKMRSCGHRTGTWHRVVMTWMDGAAHLYVDGTSAASASYQGELDNWAFMYRLFPVCCDTGKPMSLAKALVANQAWTPAQVGLDYGPTFPQIPEGGVLVTSTKLGEIHRDVLGYAQYDVDIASKPDVRTSNVTLSQADVNAFRNGLQKTGFTSVRFAGGFGGITADQANWKGGDPCLYGAPGKLGKGIYTFTDDNLDKYIPEFAKPLGLDVIYTVNYGSNPPACNAGGDPVENGAELVRYANIKKRYGIKYWEIGNELYSKTTELDLHPDGNTGASFVKYEPEFYNAMKAVDPSIKIAVPIAVGAVYSWSTEYGLPILAGGKFDAVVFHSYPVKTPITDGDTLYPERIASNLSRVRGQIRTLQTALMNNGRDPSAIWVTEWDGEKDGNKWSKQTMGAVEPMFTVMQLAEFMQAGVQSATWFAEGFSGVCTRDNYDWTGETSYSWLKCSTSVPIYMGRKGLAAPVPVGLKEGDLTPIGRGFEVLSKSGFVKEGEHMLRTEVDATIAPWLLSYAATHKDSYAVILINRDRDSTHTVPIHFAEKHSGASVHQWTYGKAQYDQIRLGNWEAEPVLSVSKSWEGNYSATLPPWSVNVLVFSK